MNASSASNDLAEASPLRPTSARNDYGDLL